MKAFTFIFFVLSLITFNKLIGQNSYLDTLNIHEYIRHPNPADQLCIDDIRRANEDIAAGKISYCLSLNQINKKVRYQKELEALCKQYRLRFQYILSNFLSLDKQTQVCYSAQMDQYIAQKY